MEDEIKEELIDQPLDGYSGPEGLVGPEGLLAELKKRLMNRVLDAELTAHLGRGKHAWANGGNVRSGKTLRSDDGKLAIEVPRDRKGELEPALSGPGGPGRPGAPAWDAQGGGLAHAHPQRHRGGGRGLQPGGLPGPGDSDGGSQGGAGDAVLPERGLQVLAERPHRAEGPGRIRHPGMLRGRPVRGHRDGLPEGREAQLRIARMLRNSLKRVSWKEKRQAASELRSLCKAPTAEAAKLALDQFRSKRDERFPAIGRSWEAHWESATPFLDCPEDIGKVHMRRQRRRAPQQLVQEDQPQP